MRNLEGKTIIVAGATGDIGGGIARKLLETGANVCGFGRNSTKLAQLKQDGVRSFEVDCTKVDDIKDAMEHVEAEFGKPHAFVTSMGNWEEVDLDYGPEKFEARLRLDLDSIVLAVINSMYYFNDYFHRIGGGFIVDVSSHAAESILPGNLTYAPAKAAVQTFVNHLRIANMKKRSGNGVVMSQIIAQLVDTPKNRQNPKLSHLTEEEWGQTVQISEMAEWIANNVTNLQASREKCFRSGIIL